VKSSKPGSWKYHPSGNIGLLSAYCTGEFSMRIMVMRQVIFDLDTTSAFLPGTNIQIILIKSLQMVYRGLDNMTSDKVNLTCHSEIKEAA
jgi:hypothetical protein